MANSAQGVAAAPSSVRNSFTGTGSAKPGRAPEQCQGPPRRSSGSSTSPMPRMPKVAQLTPPRAQAGDQHGQDRRKHDQVDGQHQQHRPHRLRPKQQRQHRDAQKADIADHAGMRLERRFLAAGRRASARRRRPAARPPMCPAGRRRRTARRRSAPHQGWPQSRTAWPTGRSRRRSGSDRRLPRA